MVLNGYCDWKQNGSQPMPAASNPLTDIWQKLEVPLQDWASLPMKTLDDIRSWLMNYQSYLVAALDYARNFDQTDLEASIRAQLFQIDQKLA